MGKIIFAGGAFYKKNTTQQPSTATGTLLVLPHRPVMLGKGL